MSDNKQPEPNPNTQDYLSTEGMVAAQAYQSTLDSDPLARAQADLAALQAKSAELAERHARLAKGLFVFLKTGVL